MSEYVSIAATIDFDNGVKSGVATETDNYDVKSGEIKLKAPMYQKDESMVMFQPMDEGAGDKLLDKTDNVNDGSLKPTPPGDIPQWVDGKYGKALDFDGSNDYVDFKNKEDFQFTKQFTFALWMNYKKFPTGQDNVYILTKGRPGYPAPKNGYVLYYSYYSESEGYLKFAVGDDVQEYMISHGKSPLDIRDQWKLIIGIFNNGKLSLYIDDSYVSDTVDVVNVNATIDSLMIGVYSHYLGSYFEGLLDALRLYNRAISHDEAIELFNNGKKYKTSGSWESAVQPFPRNMKINKLTIKYSGVDSNNYIDKVEWLSNGEVKAAYETNITSGASKTIEESDLISGSFADIRGDYTIKVHLAGDGDNTPIVTQIEGHYASLGRLLGRLTDVYKVG